MLLGHQYFREGLKGEERCPVYAKKLIKPGKCKKKLLSYRKRVVLKRERERERESVCVCVCVKNVKKVNRDSKESKQNKFSIFNSHDLSIFVLVGKP